MDTPETNTLTPVIISSVIIGIIIAYFVLSLIKNQRTFIRLTRRNFLAELALLEKDRMRIAADLHDELCPVLTAVKFQVDSIDPADENDIQAINTSKQQIDFLSQRLPGISHDLMPEALTRKDLATALQEYLTLIAKASGLNITFHHNITTDPPEDIRINCYRIIQEITQNTIKHAKASRLLVQLTQNEKEVNVLCEDNGIGFNYDHLITQGTGLGLRNIKGRVDMISNNFNVLSVHNKGTQFTFSIPLKNHI